MGNFYSNWLEKAKTSPHYARVLSAIEDTLIHFKIPESGKELMRETLIYFRVSKDKNLKYDKNDIRLETLLAMDRYLNNLLKKGKK